MGFTAHEWFYLLVGMGTARIVDGLIVLDLAQTGGALASFAFCMIGYWLWFRRG